MAEREEDLPRDAKIVKSLLRSMGVEEHEPHVVHQFLELWYRYVVDMMHKFTQSMLEKAQLTLMIQSLPSNQKRIPASQNHHHERYS